jgi:hypothetical protein
MRVFTCEGSGRDVGRTPRNPRRSARPRGQTSPNSRRAQSGQKNASVGGSSNSTSSVRYASQRHAETLLTREHSAHAST